MPSEEAAQALEKIRARDISLDEDGRVIVTNPEVAERLKAVAAERKRKPPIINVNCTEGCSFPTNICAQPPTR